MVTNFDKMIGARVGLRNYLWPHNPCGSPFLNAYVGRNQGAIIFVNGQTALPSQSIEYGATFGTEYLLSRRLKLTFWSGWANELIWEKDSNLGWFPWKVPAFGLGLGYTVLRAKNAVRDTLTRVENTYQPPRLAVSLTGNFVPFSNRSTNSSLTPTPFLVAEACVAKGLSLLGLSELNLERPDSNSSISLRLQSLGVGTRLSILSHNRLFAFHELHGLFILKPDALHSRIQIMLGHGLGYRIREELDIMASVGTKNFRDNVATYLSLGLRWNIVR
jgi:hypothetical protein